MHCVKCKMTCNGLKNQSLISDIKRRRMFYGNGCGGFYDNGYQSFVLSRVAMAGMEEVAFWSARMGTVVA